VLSSVVHLQPEICCFKALIQPVLAGAIPQHLENIPDLHRFTVWGNNDMDRRYTDTNENLGTIFSILVYETQARRQPLPNLDFF
jgi:hypothetical protein